MKSSFLSFRIPVPPFSYPPSPPLLVATGSRFPPLGGRGRPAEPGKAACLPPNPTDPFTYIYVREHGGGGPTSSSARGSDPVWGPSPPPSRPAMAHAKLKREEEEPLRDAGGEQTSPSSSDPAPPVRSRMGRTAPPGGVGGCGGGGGARPPPSPKPKEGGGGAAARGGVLSVDRPPLRPR